MLTGITPLDVVGSIVWDVMPADDCDIDERPDKPLVPAPVLYHIAGTATAVASCQTGAAIPEQGDEGRRLGLDRDELSVRAEAAELRRPGAAPRRCRRG